jgi:hypothetical protein
MALQVIMESLNSVKCGGENCVEITSIAFNFGQTAGYESVVYFLHSQLNTNASSYYTFIMDKESTNIRVLKD